MSNRQSSTGGINSWNELLKSAEDGYNDANTILAMIEILERSNAPHFIKKISQSKAGIAFGILRTAAFQQIHLLVVRAFDPVNKPDDMHLRAAIEFLRKQNQSNDTNEICSWTYVDCSIDLFDKANSDERLSKLKHMRNKQIAHWARYDEDIPRPLIRDLFDFAKDTCLIWEKLSFGAQWCSIELEHKIPHYKEAAEALWSRWEQEN
jgi:hypothetical protein